MSVAAAHWSTAFTRFGLGPRGQAPAPSGDPRAALHAELDAPSAGVLAAPDLASGIVDLATEMEAAAQRAAQLKAEAAHPPAPMMSAPAQPKGPPPLARLFLAEASARIGAAGAPSVGFVERLVAFWSNHFCVSAAKGAFDRALAGAYEREAIRPHVLGRFADMLLAAEKHPAMLYFLDNAQSIGPDSPLGRASHRGLNENLGREIMELHTLGVDGGYSQADVTELARMLTGWTAAPLNGRLGTPGAFAFNAAAHEGGPRRLLGKLYPAGGVEQGEAALADFARAPATARHIATKFARAFVADEPPPGLVARLAGVFARSDGDLRALARALIDDEAAWSAPPTQIRDPWEMTMAAYRALGLGPDKAQRALYSMALLGMPLWSPAGPNGFPVAADAWLSPEGMKSRVDVAVALARLAKDAGPPAELIARVLPDASEATRRTLLGAESRPQAYALMILAPEFQRR